MSADVMTEKVEPPEPGDSELAPREFDDEPEQQAEIEEQPEAKADAEDDDEKVEGAVEFKPGEKYVPLSAVVEARREAKAARTKLKEIEPQLEKIGEIERWYHEKKPYVEFIEQNRDFLKRKEEPPKPQPPQEDKEAAEYAHRFQLYTKDGVLDAPTARAILDDHRRIAQEEAQRAVQPYAQQTLEQKAAGNLALIKNQKDADGNELTDEALNATAGLLIQQMGRDNALRLFADPGNAAAIAAMAHGFRVMTPKKAAVKPPAEPPLETERAGGAPRETRVSDRSLRLTGLSEKDYRDRAKRFKPGETNSLED